MIGHFITVVCGRFSALSPPLIAPVCLEEVMLCDSLAESWSCLLEPVETHTLYQVLKHVVLI